VCQGRHLREILVGPAGLEPRYAEGQMLVCLAPSEKTVATNARETYA
jgi:hypothetical protein